MIPNMWFQTAVKSSFSGVLRHILDSRDRECFVLVPKSRFAEFLVFTTIILQAIFSSFGLSSAARASDVCLRISMPELLGQTTVVENYRRIMKEAGLCVIPIPLPMVRGVIALRQNEIDGVFAGLEGFAQVAGLPLVHGDEALAHIDGMLVVRENTVQSVSELRNEAIAIWLGSRWAEDLMTGYSNLTRVPQGPASMLAMLGEGRLDGALLNAFSLGANGGVPAGFVALPVASLTVHTWIRAEYADLLPKLDEGTVAYRSYADEWYEQMTEKPI